MRYLFHQGLGNVARSIRFLVLGLCLIPGGGVAAQQEVVIVDFGQERDGVPREWELSETEGKADLALVMDGSGPVLRLRSKSTSFGFQKEVTIDLKQTPILQWEWKVTKLPKGGDFRRSAWDDQAAQLYVMFSPDIMQTEVIGYIWDSTAPKGTMAEPQFPPLYPFLCIRMVVVESGDAEKGKWITVTRNVLEDYKKLFGGNPDEISGIRIQINSQHTKSQAEAYWRYVKAKARP